VDPAVLGASVFAGTFGGVLAGMKLRGLLPEHHLSGESGNTIKAGIGLIATMTALLLGLVTASAKGSFESLLKTRWLAFAGHGASIPSMFLTVLVFWLTLTFVSFGMSAPWSATVVSVLFLCAVSVAGSVLTYALARLGR
jgi:hypothetical protein